MIPKGTDILPLSLFLDGQLDRNPTRSDENKEQQDDPQKEQSSYFSALFFFFFSTIKILILTQL